MTTEILGVSLHDFCDPFRVYLCSFRAWSWDIISCPHEPGSNFPGLFRERARVSLVVAGHHGLQVRCLSLVAHDTSFQSNMKCDICIRKEMYVMSRFQVARLCSQGSVDD